MVLFYDNNCKRTLLRLVREPFGVLDDRFGEDHVDIWPVELPRRRLLHVQDGSDRLLLEPREFLVGHEDSGCIFWIC